MGKLPVDGVMQMSFLDVNTALLGTISGWLSW